MNIRLILDLMVSKTVRFAIKSVHFTSIILDIPFNFRAPHKTEIRVVNFITSGHKLQNTIEN